MAGSYCQLEAGGGGAGDHLYPAGVEKGTVVVLQSFFRIVLRSKPHKGKLPRLAVFGANDLRIGNLRWVEENGQDQLTASYRLLELQRKEVTIQNGDCSLGHCLVGG